MKLLTYKTQDTNPSLGFIHNNQVIDMEDFGEISTQAKPPSQRPPHFDHLMNSVRFLTRKVDHIHVFYFN